MIGDQTDLLTRVKKLLPPWFGAGLTAILDATVSGIAAALSFIYSLYAYAVLQTRIATATDGFLDLIALDFFGDSVLRRTGQTDPSFRATILSNLIRERGTRRAIVSIVTDLTGKPPVIIEPQRPADCGAWGVGIWGYGVAGAYGSRMMPWQAFVQATLPATGGIPNVDGWGGYSGGYGVGAIEWADLSMVTGQITAQDVYNAINTVKPEGTTVWVRAA